MSGHDHGMMSTTTVDPHAGHNHHNHMNVTSSMSTTGHNHGDMDHSGSSHQMMMVMHAGLKEIIVFPGWKTQTLSELIGSCVALMFIAILYEGLKLVRDKVTEKKIFNHKRGKIDINDSKGEIGRIKSRPSYFESLLSLDHLIHTILHVLQFTISYFIMLAFMTYNYWLCLSILIGIGIGFFFFGLRRSKIDLNEDCH
ncbi:unnamed protein product [Brachionus calyciflorus]|uniref:Copper transport protein n=1 Tax=Brachionus calyciflorus TaxID=104777 RepID=A0A814CZ81_9BILA|nr:unnamed protein product [Brachionus calyciflorus]